METSIKHTGLGLVAIGPREISTGDQVDYLFPKPDNQDSLVIANGNIHQIVMELGKVVRKYKSDTHKLAPLLEDSSLEGTCRNVWEFVFNHLQYKKDKAGEEQLRRPARSWAERETGVDCDCMSIFISTILANLGIDHHIRITKYDGKPEFQHVYPIVPFGHNQHFTIDCVVSEFNYEKPFSDSKDYTMSELGIPVSVLHGLDEIPAGASPEEKSTFDYLANYRAYVIQNPYQAQLAAGSAATLIKMLDYAIENFWKGDEIRDKAFAALDAEERRLKLFPGLSGIEEAELSGFFKSIGSGLKKAANAVTSTAKKVNVAVNKVNPLSVAMKAAFRQLVQMNYQGLATRLAYGRASLFDTAKYPESKLRPILREILSESEIDAYFKYVKRVNDACEVYRNAFGGTGKEWDNLKGVIKQGALHKAVGFPERVEEARQLRMQLEKILALYKKKFNINALGDLDNGLASHLGDGGTSAALITAAGALLAAVGTKLGGAIGETLTAAGKTKPEDVNAATELFARWKAGQISEAEYKAKVSLLGEKAVKAATAALQKTTSALLPVESQNASDFPYPATGSPGTLENIKSFLVANPVLTAIAGLGLAYIAFPIFKKKS